MHEAWANTVFTRSETLCSSGRLDGMLTWLWWQEKSKEEPGHVRSSRITQLQLLGMEIILIRKMLWTKFKIKIEKKEVVEHHLRAIFVPNTSYLWPFCHSLQKTAIVNFNSLQIVFLVLFFLFKNSHLKALKKGIINPESGLFKLKIKQYH